MPTLKKNSAAALVLKTLVVGLMLFLNIGQPALAQLDRNQYSQFKVGDYLTLKENTDGKTGAGVTTGSQDQTYLKSSNPTASFILQAINLVALMAASLSFLAVVVAGFMMMTSTGNETQRNRGVEILTRAVVGLVITLSAYFIVSFVQNLLFETAGK
jgi:hypothetical protein